jgi:glycosyl hydrolase family 16
MVAGVSDGAGIAPPTGATSGKTPANRLETGLIEAFYRAAAGLRSTASTYTRGVVVRFELEFEDTFEGDDLDLGRWVPSYLPQWSSRARSAARYEVSDGRLRLRIDHDQEPWCPELDGDVRVSSLQTGVFAGPVGSAIGQHRFRPGVVVREAQENVRLYTPQYGRIELRAQATDDPRSMVCLWLIGYEDEPERSAEICVCEIFGRDVGERDARVGMGVHPFGDPAIVDEFEAVAVPIDARELHEYACEWLPERVDFLVDGELVKTVAQSPAYPMQLMLGIYELPVEGEPDPPHEAARYPKEFVVESVRGYRLV